MCYYCPEDKQLETIEHLFFECKYTQQFWRSFSSWYECLTDTEIELTMETIFFCNYPNKIFLNVLLIMAKQYIFSKHIAEQELSLYTFKDRLMQNVECERTEAIKNQKCKKFVKRWHLLFPAAQ